MSDLKCYPVLKNGIPSHYSGIMLLARQGAV